MVTSIEAVEMSRSSGGITRGRHIPGEPGIWVFVLFDMLIFAEMFVIFAWYRAENGELFRVSQDKLIPLFGLVYTLLLLTSSWCIVSAVVATRKRLLATASKLVSVGIALGAAFVALKLVEYGVKFASGVTPQTDDFFMFYFVVTVVHLLHTFVGLGVLVYMRQMIKSLTGPPPSGGPRTMRVIEVSAIYWHMVDLLWIVIFAIFYLKG